MLRSHYKWISDKNLSRLGQQCRVSGKEERGAHKKILGMKSLLLMKAVDQLSLRKSLTTISQS